MLQYRRLQAKAGQGHTQVQIFGSITISVERVVFGLVGQLDHIYVSKTFLKQEFKSG